MFRDILSGLIFALTVMIAGLISYYAIFQIILKILQYWGD